MLTSCKDELPNPHRNVIREILNTLVCHDNDFRRTNIELRNLQNEFKQEMEKIEYRCTLIRKPSCSEQDRVMNFEQHIADIDEVNQCFTQKIDTVKNNREQILETARTCLNELNLEKCKFKTFHEKTVDYLKRYAIKSDDPAVHRNCEKDICEMHKLFVKEVSFIKRCENELLPFFKQLSDADFQYFCNCCCFKDYEWIPKGKTFAVVEDIADRIKNFIGSTLTKAFAQAHIHQAEDPRSFLAGYLMNVQRNQWIIEQKLDLFGNLI